MSLLNTTAGNIINLDAAVHTGAGTFTIYTPPAGERVLISDLSISSEEATECRVHVGSSIKRRVFLAATSPWIEAGMRVPIVGEVDEVVKFQIVAASANASISINGEHLKA